MKYHIAKMSRPNVVFLTVDSMRWDRIGRNGYTLPVTPEIDAMLKHAIACASTYSLSPSTIGAFPSIMTSTRPLSYGGFDVGIFHRPPTLAAVLARAGYDVLHIATPQWVTSFLGYCDGSIQEELLVGLWALAKAPGSLLRNSFAQYNRGQLSIEALVEIANKVLPIYFHNLLKYCEHHDNGLALPIPSENSQVGWQRYRWRAVRGFIEATAEEFRRDPSSFLEDASAHFARTGRWPLDRSWREYRVRNQLVQSGMRAFLAKLLSLINPSLASRINKPLKPYIDAEALVNIVLSRAEALRQNGKPFFIWTHFFDAHIPFTCGSGRDWIKDTANWVRRAGHTTSIDPMMTMGPRPKTAPEWTAWCTLYDAALCFIDHHIGRLRHSLQRLGLGNTVIVVSADHGEELGEHGDTSHKFRLYEHNARVPTLFYHPDFGDVSVPGLSTVMDIAPTITDLASVSAPGEWEGQPLHSLRLDPRAQVLLETTFGSPCDVINRPVYFAVREGRFKLMYNEKVDPNDPLSIPGAALFDVESDPNERVNLAWQEPQIVETLMQPIHERLSDLRLACGKGTYGGVLV